MAEYDLTQTIIPYCDRHLVFPLLAHLAENDLFEQEQVQNAQYELANFSLLPSHHHHTSSTLLVAYSHRRRWTVSLARRRWRQP